MTAGRHGLPVIFATAFLRSAGIGLLGVALGVYLYRAGLSSTAIGLVIGAGLAGAAVAQIGVGRFADRWGRRRSLFLLAMLGGMGGVGLAVTAPLPGMLLLAFFTMLNGMGTDRTAAYALEQAIIPQLVGEQRRTWALSWYNLVLDAGHAVGALGAGAPLALAHWLHLDVAAAYRTAFLLLGAVTSLSGALYWLLAPAAEAMPRPAAPAAPAASASRRTIQRLAALSAVDSLGGGLLSDALISYWFFRRFGLDEQQLALLFFAVHVLNAASYVGAAWLARRFGLLNTMVFTHLPSSLLLLAVPLAPTAWVAVGLFLAREALVEMDVPTRQSYLAAVVAPEERTYASVMTNVTRNVSWAGASSVSGALIQHAGLAAPLYLGGALKITYDVLLYRGFRKLKPPEEVVPGGGSRGPSGPLAASGAHPS